MENFEEPIFDDEDEFGEYPHEAEDNQEPNNQEPNDESDDLTSKNNL